MNNGRWKKISGMSKPLEITENGRVTKFNINKKNREQNQKKLQRQILARIESGEFQSKTAKEAKTKAANWIQKNVGSQIQTEIGDITINSNCLDDSFGHGPYPAKFDAVKAIKPILTQGVYLGEMDDLYGADIKNYYFTGKIKLDGNEKFVFCRIRESESGQTGKRFYLHSVYTEDDIKKGALNKSAPAQNGKNNSGAPLELRLIQNFLNCK